MGRDANSMDPNTAYDNMMDAVQKLMGPLNNDGEIDQEAVVKMAESFSSLDHWLSVRGFMPVAWTTTNLMKDDTPNSGISKFILNPSALILRIRPYVSEILYKGPNSISRAELTSTVMHICWLNTFMVLFGWYVPSLWS